MSWWGSWLGEIRGGGRSPVHRRENLKVVSFAANSRATMAIWAAGVGALSRPPLAGPAGKSLTIILAIFRNSAVSVFPQAAGRLADGCGQPPWYGLAPGSGGRAAAWSTRAWSAAVRPDQI